MKAISTEQRLTRLEGVVERLAATTAGFIKSATEFQNDVTRILKAHDESIHELRASVRELRENVYELRQMVSRFDQWLRGQGPTKGREKRNPRG